MPIIAVIVWFGLVGVVCGVSIRIIAACLQHLAQPAMRSALLPANHIFYDAL
jgi:hypothetical protein